MNTTLQTAPNRRRRRRPLDRLWVSAIRAMQHPAFELTCEEFAAFDSIFLRLQRRGHEFDPALVALMDVLRAQARQQRRRRRSRRRRLPAHRRRALR